MSELRFDPRNYRIHDEKNKRLIRKSLEDCGAGRSILFDKDNCIIAGNGVYEQAMELGLPVRVIESDGTELIAIKRTDLATEDARRKALALADNHTSDTSIFDVEAILEDFTPEELDLWEFSVDDLQINDFIESTPEEDDYDISSTRSTSISPNDIIEIGRHRIICGDSTLSDNYKTLFGCSKADMVLIDPPYNVDYSGATSEALTILNDKMEDKDFLAFLTNSFINASDYTKDGGPWYIWHADSQGENFRRAMREAGILLKQTLIWVKNAMVIGRQDYQWQHEPCLYGWKPGAAHKWYSDRKQTTILNYDKPLRNKEHPTMKPIKLFSNLIVNSSKRGDIVFDGFLGSGTTMVSCEQLGRTCYGFELDPLYCQVIIDRMRLMNPKIEVRINNLLMK